MIIECGSIECGGDRYRDDGSKLMMLIIMVVMMTVMMCMDSSSGLFAC